MTRRLRIEWMADHKVTGLLAMPPDPASTGVLLANGAGGTQRSSFISAMRSALAASGYPVLTFDYPYQEAGRRSPDPRHRLDACHAAAAARLAGYVDRIVWAGKSMGGRIATHLVAEGARAAGVLVFGYPLVPVGKVEPRDPSHLGAIEVPVLFIQGTRDRLAPLELLIPAVQAAGGVDVALIDDADHSYKVPRRTGLAPGEVLDDVAAVAVAWLNELPAQL